MQFTPPQEGPLFLGEKMDIKINKLLLPPVMLDLINTGNWKVPRDKSLLQKAFPKGSIVDPHFYDLEMLELENRHWSEEHNIFYLGTKNQDTPPGDIDPNNSIIIGDLGPDRLIALDYRKSSTEPSVIYLTGNEKSIWLEAFPEIESMLISLKIL